MQRPFSYVKQTYILLTLADLTLPRYQYGLAVAIFLANMLSVPMTTDLLDSCHCTAFPFTYGVSKVRNNAIVSTSGIHDGLDGSHPALFSRAQFQCQHPDTWHSPTSTAAYAPDWPVLRCQREAYLTTPLLTAIWHCSSRLDLDAIAPTPGIHQSSLQLTQLTGEFWDANVKNALVDSHLALFF
jgi:hypothetical protein